MNHLLGKSPTMRDRFRAPTRPSGEPYRRLVPVHWQTSFLETIQKILETPKKVRPHTFRFEPTLEAARANSSFMQQCGGLRQAIEAQRGSSVYFGSEFRDAETLEPLLKSHFLWPRVRSLLTNGASYPLEPIDEEERLLDVAAAVKRGNHKSAKDNPEAFSKIVSDEITRGFYLPLTTRFASSLPGAEFAPQGFVTQGTINEHGDVILKNRVTHDQSHKWPGSKTSVNSRTITIKLTPCVFGNTMRRTVHFIVGCRLRHPKTRILGSKSDFSKAYKRAHFDPETAVKCCTVFDFDGKPGVLAALRIDR